MAKRQLMMKKTKKRRLKTSNGVRCGNVDVGCEWRKELVNRQDSEYELIEEKGDSEINDEDVGQRTNEICDGDRRKRKRRDRPKGTTLQQKKGTLKLRSQSQYTAKDVLHMAQAWINMSQRRIMTEYSFWNGVERICKELHGMTQTAR